VNDRAIWVTWYDLPEAGREAYFAWLHARYIPGILSRPGILWAAHYESVEHHLPPGRVQRVADPGVPAGHRYILLFGARDSHAYADPVPSKLNAALRQDEREMIALRSGERTGVFVEEARVDGPESDTRARAHELAPCIQIGSFNASSWQAEEGLLEWYAMNRMAAMRDLPGCLGVRKYISVCGWAKHAVLYEFTSLEMRNRHFPSHADNKPDLKTWSDRLVPSLMHAPHSPDVAVRLWPALPAGQQSRENAT
jgi:hypothetical protein